MKWDFKINITTLLAIVLGVVVLFWWNGRKNDEITRWESNFAAQATEFVTYKSEIDGVLIAKNETIALTQAELRGALESDSISKELVEYYKKLASVTKVVTKFVHDTVYQEVPIYVENDTTITLTDPCFKLDLSLSTGLLAVNNIDIQNRQDIVIGARKNGLWKTQYSVDVRNTNSCIHVTGLSTKVVVEPKKWWENPLIMGLGGFTAGFIVNGIVGK